MLTPSHGEPSRGHSVLPKKQSQPSSKPSSLMTNCASPNRPATTRRQVMLRVFFFFATFGEALSQTAQAFIPGQLARERALKAAKAAASLASDSVDPANPVKEHTAAVFIDPRRSPARAMMRCVVLGFSMFRSLLLTSESVGA